MCIMGALSIAAREAHHGPPPNHWMVLWESMMNSARPGTRLERVRRAARAVQMELGGA